MSTRELLETVKQRILEHPGDYDQATFCGTACCIAGHIDVVLNGLHAHVMRPFKSKGADRPDVEQIAMDALGETETLWLFGQPRAEFDDDDHEDEDDPDFWPLDLSREYNSAGLSGRAKVACKAIDMYMEERGI